MSLQSQIVHYIFFLNIMNNAKTWISRIRYLTRNSKRSPQKLGQIDPTVSTLGPLKSKTKTEIFFKKDRKKGHEIFNLGLEWNWIFNFFLLSISSSLNEWKKGEKPNVVIYLLIYIVTPPPPPTPYLLPLLPLPCFLGDETPDISPMRNDIWIVDEG